MKKSAIAYPSRVRTTDELATVPNPSVNPPLHNSHCCPRLRIPNTKSLSLPKRSARTPEQQPRSENEEDMDDEASDESDDQPSVNTAVSGEGADSAATSPIVSHDHPQKPENSPSEADIGTSGNVDNIGQTESAESQSHSQLLADREDVEGVSHDTITEAPTEDTNVPEESTIEVNRAQLEEQLAESTPEHEHLSQPTENLLPWPVASPRAAEYDCSSQASNGVEESILGELSPKTLEDLSSDANVDEKSHTTGVDEHHTSDDNVGEESQEPQTDEPLCDNMSVASVDSFHSLTPYPSQGGSPPFELDLEDGDDPPSPTPMPEDFNPLDVPFRQHKREISEITVTTSSADADSAIHAEPSFGQPRTSRSNRPLTPILIRSSASDSSWPDVETPSSPLDSVQLRHRKSPSRSFSPPPLSSNVFAPSSPKSQGNHLTSAILQKACSVALGKPIEVVVMLAHILIRIAGGATVNDLISGDLFRNPNRRREHRRNSSLPDQVDGDRHDDWDEDDFGVPLRTRSRSVERARREADAESLSALD